VLYLVIPFACVAAIVTVVSLSRTGMGPKNPAPEQLEVSKGLFRTLSAGSPRIGPDLPLITLVVLSEPACATCLSVAAGIRHLRHKFPQHVAVVWKVVPATENLPDVVAARQIFCAATVKAFADTARVAGDFPSAFLEGALGGVTAGRSRVAEDDSSFVRCVEDAGTARAIASAIGEANHLRTHGLPVLLMNGRILPGVLTDSALDAIISSEFPSRRKNFGRP
jgi:protein-disulfide isomerase